MTLQAIDAARAEDLDQAFAAILTGAPDALFVEPSPLTFTNRKRILEFVSQNRLVAAHGFKETVDAGALISYGPSLVGQARQAATFVDKILRGAKPGDLPVEQPTQFELAINLRTAKRLHLTVPPSLLVRADHVIQ